MRLQDYDHGKRYAARLARSERITPPGSVEVRELHLEVAAEEKMTILRRLWEITLSKVDETML